MFQGGQTGFAVIVLTKAAAESTEYVLENTPAPDYSQGKNAAKKTIHTFGLFLGHNMGTVSRRPRNPKALGLSA